MGVVIDEILTEVPAPGAERAESSGGSSESRVSSGLASSSELQQALEHLRIRQLRLMAD